MNKKSPLRFTMLAVSLIFSFSNVSHASSVDEVKIVCGLSDFIHNYISSTMKEQPKKMPMSALLGSGRFLMQFKNLDWILTLEMLSEGDVKNDTTCILAKGDKSTLSMATDIFKKAPWVGPLIEAPKPTVPNSTPGAQKNPHQKQQPPAAQVGEDDNKEDPKNSMEYFIHNI